jgi:pyrimidine/purine-5'-nucleotide nucleosidase
MITYVNPVGSMALLSQLEVDRLQQAASGEIYQLYRNCSLAVLNSGSKSDSSKEILEKYQNFSINVISRERGVKLELFNAPASAFVDGEIIRGLQEHLFSVLRDILYVSNKQEANLSQNLTSSSHITNLVFSILRNARTIRTGEVPNMIVCWGGHSINETEYHYSREVGRMWTRCNGRPNERGCGWSCESTLSAPSLCRLD